MSTNAKEASKQNLIGKEVSVVNSLNKSLIGKKGTIIDETKNTLRINNKKQKYTLIKKQVTLDICGTRIEGEDLEKKAIERILRIKK